MFWFILALIVLIVAAVGVAIAFGFARKAKNASSSYADDYKLGRNGFGIGAGVAVLLAALFFFFSGFYTNGVGEGKVLINLDGTVAGEVITPGSGFKAPWQEFNDWDLFAQNISYVAGGDTNYSGGKVQGPQITSAVANGAQVNLDLSVVYSIDSNDITELYSQFRTQENFTKQVIENAIRSVTRDIPSQYSAVEFRGEKRGEAQTRIQEALQKNLEKWGVKIEVVNLQEIRYSDDVENSLRAVEVANQREAEAAANLRATEISARAQVVEAQAQADANNLLTASLSPQILQQRYIDKLGEGTVYVVPDGSTPFVGTK